MYETIQKLSKKVKSSFLLESWKRDNFMVSNRKKPNIVIAINRLTVYQILICIFGTPITFSSIVH